MQRVLTIPSPVQGDSKRALQAGSKTAPSVTRCPAGTHNTQEAIMFTRISRTASRLRAARPGAAARSRLSSNHSRVIARPGVAARSKLASNHSRAIA
jgi:hypothetical protein